MAAVVLCAPVLLSNGNCFGHYECRPRCFAWGVRLGQHRPHIQYERGGAAQRGGRVRGRSCERSPVAAPALLSLGRHLHDRPFGHGGRALHEHVHRVDGARERSLVGVGLQHRSHSHHELVSREKRSRSGFCVHGTAVGIRESDDIPLGLRTLGRAFGYGAVRSFGWSGAFIFWDLASPIDRRRGGLRPIPWSGWMRAR